MTKNTLNIIHIFERQDRYSLLIPELEKQEINDYKLWEAVQNPYDRKEGICKSHKAIVQDAKNRGLERVHIAEDDITFFGEGAWEYYLSQIPENYDLFMGMVYVGTADNENRINSACSAFTLYTIHHNFYDSFLSVPDSCHIDREITGMHDRYLMKIIDKFVCYQNGTKSSNTFMTCDYSPYLEGRKIYGKE